MHKFGLVTRYSSDIFKRTYQDIKFRYACPIPEFISPVYFSEPLTGTTGGGSLHLVTTQSLISGANLSK